MDDAWEPQTVPHTPQKDTYSCGILVMKVRCSIIFIVLTLISFIFLQFWFEISQTGIPDHSQLKTDKLAVKQYRADIKSEILSRSSKQNVLNS